MHVWAGPCIRAQYLSSPPAFQQPSTRRKTGYKHCH